MLWTVAFLACITTYTSAACFHHIHMHTLTRCPALPAGRWCPEETAGFLSRILFLWVGGLIRLGYGKALDAGDLWDMATVDSAATVSEAFAWNLSSSQVVPDARLAAVQKCGRAGTVCRLLLAGMRGWLCGAR